VLEVVKLVGVAETVETRELFISHTLVNSTSKNLNISNADYLLAAFIHVTFRRSHPDEETVEEVKKELQKNNIDVSKMVKWRANHCQQWESSTEGGSSE